MNNQQAQNPSTGLFVIGVLKGVREQNQNNGAFINYFAGISVETVDQYGQIVETVEELSINQYQYADISNQKHLFGQPVIAPFKISLRKGVTDKGKPWAFVSQYLPRDCHIELLNKVQSIPEKKTA